MNLLFSGSQIYFLLHGFYLLCLLFQQRLGHLASRILVLAIGRSSIDKGLLRTGSAVCSTYSGTESWIDRPGRGSGIAARQMVRRQTAELHVTTQTFSDAFVPCMHS